MTRIAIRDSTDSYNIGFLDNTNGIKYHLADLEIYAQGSAFLDLKYYSKTQIVDVGMRLAFVFRGKDYWMTVTSVSRESEYEYQVEARSLSLEALREVRSSYKASRNMTFKEYIDAFDPEHSIRLNVNTISNRSRKLEWTGEDTILARILSLAIKFDAEIEFETELNDDYSLKEFRLNVHALNELGKDRTGIPFRISNSQLKLIKFKSSIDEFYSAIRGTGKDGLSISGLDKKVYDDEKKLLFYTSGGTIYAPQARDKFISITNKKTSDGYIVREFDSTEHETKEALYAYMLGELKKHCEPQIDYTIDGYIDADVNDKVLLIDDKYTTDDLMLTARVNKQKWSLIDKLQGNNRTELSNYVRVYSEVADELITRMNALIEANKVYDVQILTSDGYSFKNGQGSTTLTARVMDGAKDVTNEFSVNWYRENDLIGPDASITVQASSIDEKVVYRIIAYKDGVERGRSELTLINVNDGVGGRDGQDGTSVFNFDTNYQYKQSEIDKYGTVGYRGVWNVIGDTSQVKVGDTVILSVLNIDKQSKSLIFGKVNGKGSISLDCTTTALVEKGEVGPPGLDGRQGEKGDQGIQGRPGVDGRTPYAHIAYADSADGTKNFSVSDSHRLYIGFYTDFNATDSTNPSAYRWTLIKGADGQDGADGLPGKPGADGRTPYFHTAYADSADGQLGFSTTNASGKLYMGTCTDYIQLDPTDYRAYTWVKIKGDKGETGPAGHDGRDGKGVKSYAITYQAGTSGVSYPTGNWSSTIPNVPNGQYLWSKTTLTYTDNTTSDTYSVAYFPVNGATGATGNGISSYTAEFYLSTSKTSQSGGSWTTTPPTWSNGKYIWTRYKIGYTNGSTAYTTPHCSSEWEAVNEIQIGGRNLLFKTGFFDGDQLSGVVGDGNKINLSKTIIADANSPSGKAYRINKYKKGTENVYGGCYWSMPKKLVAGKKYTWSVYVRGAGTVDAFGPEQGGFKSVKLTNTWTKVSHTFTANSNQYFQFVFYSNTEFDLYFTDLMLEEGNAPTPWSPAPEDTQDQIDQANINISNKVDQNAYNTDQITIWDSINSKMDDAEFRAFQTVMNNLKSSYDAFVGEGGRYEKELQNASKREQAIIQDFGEKVQQFNFINTYIRESEEGIVIGAKNNPMQMLLSKDSLSFMDGGQTVAYFSNQSFYINRGAVVDSLQVGVHKLTKIDNYHTVIQYIPQ
ncbi:phage tail protein [Enterococcus cecorum]|uniref:hypothetical protein n=1 Tax=Enterococcus cecorum TaxID=44008 RepID=UPI000A8A7BB2|nr:hypothetical protein [Enterococcus cecorum]CAI3334353.1 phage tail protein [Enterococcus cecorum]